MYIEKTLRWIIVEVWQDTVANTLVDVVERVNSDVFYLSRKLTIYQENLAVILLYTVV